jgi:nicotinate-nucleotide pyrophosphorylase (carboxylating)
MMTGLDRIIENALAEDIHTGDLTTLSIVKDHHETRARLIAKEPMVLAGVGAAARVYHLLDQRVLFTNLFNDGDEISSGNIIAELLGDASILLQGERVALNILQRMCGVATLTARYVSQVRGTAARIVDTRKTAPGLRSLDKYAVRAGGGFNHRFGLYDGVLIKENHIAAAGGIAVAVARARDNIPHLMKIEVETETMAQVAEALACGADVIMLDNMDSTAMREAVALIAGRALVEASGGVNLETVREIAETGVNIISVGALTHSCRAMDISMLLEGS